MYKEATVALVADMEVEHVKHHHDSPTILRKQILHSTHH